MSHQKGLLRGVLFVCGEVGTASQSGLLGREHQADTALLCEALFVLYPALTP